MNPEIEKLIKNLREQDDRADKCPVFMVQRLGRIWNCYETGEYVWLNRDWEEADEDKARELEDQDDFGLDEQNTKEGWQKIGYKDNWVNVQPFFTEVAANEYININGHNLGGRENCRIYVESGYRNYEWELIRNYFLNLDKGNS